MEKAIDGRGEEPVAIFTPEQIDTIRVAVAVTNTFGDTIPDLVSYPSLLAIIGKLAIAMGIDANNLQRKPTFLFKAIRGMYWTQGCNCCMSWSGSSNPMSVMGECEANMPVYSIVGNVVLKDGHGGRSVYTHFNATCPKWDPKEKVS